MFENNDIIRNKITGESFRIIGIRKDYMVIINTLTNDVKTISPINYKNYIHDEYYSDINMSIEDIKVIIAQYAMSLNKEVVMTHRVNITTFRTCEKGRNFALVTRGLSIFALRIIYKSVPKHLRKYVRKAPKKHRWTLNGMFCVTKESDIEVAKELINNSYKYRINNVEGRGRQAWDI